MGVFRTRRRAEWPTPNRRKWIPFKLALTSIYEITIIEGRSGEILVRGGQFFPELTPARLTGATIGGCFCKMRGIYTGFRMEINASGQRTVTTPVESIGVLV